MNNNEARDIINEELLDAVTAALDVVRNTAVPGLRKTADALAAAGFAASSGAVLNSIPSIQHLSALVVMLIERSTK